MRQLPIIILFALTACHSPIHYPPAGYDYASFVPDKDTAASINFVSGGTGDDSAFAPFGKACQELVRYAGMENKIQIYWVPKIDADTARKPLIIEDVQLEEVKEEPPKRKPKHKGASHPHQNASPNPK